MSSSNFIPKKISERNLTVEGEIETSSPSNIALIKYWGKEHDQIPKNPSISFTLSNCRTKTNLAFFPKRKTKKIEIDVFFEGKENESFKQKILAFFEKIKQYAPFLNHFSFIIKTENTFPHSSGIASSASGMSALAKVIVELEIRLGTVFSQVEKDQKASFLARLGSGSACRSIYPGLVLWGEHPKFEKSSDLYGIPYNQNAHSIFSSYRDAILIISKGQKKVSSTLGHQLMNNHPYAKQRFRNANENLIRLASALAQGNTMEFAHIVEHEALSLHAMMMTSHPSFLLMKPNTIRAIEKIQSFRSQSQIPVCFTLDAGANVHLLYPQKDEEKVNLWIAKELKKLCEGQKIIFDQVAKL